MDVTRTERKTWIISLPDDASRCRITIHHYQTVEHAIDVGIETWIGDVNSICRRRRLQFSGFCSAYGNFHIGGSRGELIYNPRDRRLPRGLRLQAFEFSHSRQYLERPQPILVLSTMMCNDFLKRESQAILLNRHLKAF